MKFNMKCSHKKRNNKISLINNVEIFSELELSLSRSCNLKCFSCPHGNKEYQSINDKFIQYMPLTIIDQIIDELIKIKWSGTIDIAGLGEPTLNPNFIEIIDKLISIKNINIRLVTNAIIYFNNIEKFKLLIKKIKNFNNFEILISLYNIKNKKKCEKLKEIAKSNNVDCKIKFIYSENRDKDDIIKEFNFNNRGGLVDLKNSEVQSNTCFYPFFMLFVSPNGDVQYCPHKWDNSLKIDNILEKSLKDIWEMKTTQRKLFLEHRRQDISECSVCSVNGTIIGIESFNNFKKEYKI